MAQVGKVIYDILSNDGTVSGFVSTRIYPLFAPQETPDPCITYFRDQVSLNETKDAASSLNTEDWRINVFSKTYTECEDITDGVIAALNRVTGTNNGVKVSNVVLKNVINLYDNIDKVFQNTIEFDFVINE